VRESGVLNKDDIPNILSLMRLHLDGWTVPLSHSVSLMIIVHEFSLGFHSQMGSWTNKQVSDPQTSVRPCLG